MAGNMRLGMTEKAGLTTTTNGNLLDLQGDAMAKGAAPGQIKEWPIEVFVGNTTTTSTASVTIEESTDGTTFTAWGTFTFTSDTVAVWKNRVGTLKKRFMRVRVSAIAGGANIKAYLRIG